MFELSKVSLFENLSSEELDDIYNSLSEVLLEKDHLFLKEGENCRNLYLVESGELDVFISNKTGSYFSLGTLKTGNYFGEFSFLEEYKRSSSVITTQKTKLLEITQDDFSDIISRHPTVYKTIVKNLIKLIKSKDSQIKRLLIKDNYPILRQYLIEHSVEICRRETRRSEVTAEKIANEINSPADIICYILFYLEDHNYINIEIDIISIYKNLPLEASFV